MKTRTGAEERQEFAHGWLMGDKASVLQDVKRLGLAGAARHNAALYRADRAANQVEHRLFIKDFLAALEWMLAHP